MIHLKWNPEDYKKIDEPDFLKIQAGGITEITTGTKISLEEALKKQGH